MSEFTIGPGVLQAMQDAGDEPRGDERYVQDGISETFGRDALYVYIAQDNATKRLAFDAGE
jgi:hypothetical protein